MSYGYGGYSGFGYNNYGYGGPLARDVNHDGLITKADFVQGAAMRGWGYEGTQVAAAAFNSYDRNHNGYLDRQDANSAYGYLHRLYS